MPPAESTATDAGSVTVTFSNSFCGTVSYAQLYLLLSPRKAKPRGTCNLGSLSFEPASIKHTEISGLALSLFARTQPAEPAPKIIKSKLSIKYPY